MYLNNLNLNPTLNSSSFQFFMNSQYLLTTLRYYFGGFYLVMWEGCSYLDSSGKRSNMQISLAYSLLYGLHTQTSVCETGGMVLLAAAGLQHLLKD